MGKREFELAKAAGALFPNVSEVAFCDDTGCQCKTVFIYHYSSDGGPLVVARYTPEIARMVAAELIKAADDAEAFAARGGRPLS